jgi:hypothetical protein
MKIVKKKLRKPTKEFDQNDLPRSKYVEICYKKTTN